MTTTDSRRRLLFERVARPRVALVERGRPARGERPVGPEREADQERGEQHLEPVLLDDLGRAVAVADPGRGIKAPL